MLGGYGKYLTRKRQEEKRQASPYPKGFDITLADVISEFNLNELQIGWLGRKTANRQIASAAVGNNVFYRRATIERLIDEMPKVITAKNTKVSAVDGQEIDLRQVEITVEHGQ